MRKLLAIAVLGACSDTVTVGELQEVVSIKAIPNPNLDLLFVVDNSSSMTPHQASLAAGFPQIIDRLRELDDGLPNLHIGVVTSDMGASGTGGVLGPDLSAGIGGCYGHGDDGVLRTDPSFTGSFISDVSDGAGGRLTNYTGELRDVFGGLAQVGDQGCGFEQHLSAMRAALSNPANAGFVRDDANLAVVIIGDEDDCSALDPGSLFDSTGGIDSYRCTRFGVTCDEDLDSVGPKTNCSVRSDSTMIEDVQPFVDAVVALKGDPRKVMVSGIVGDPTPVGIHTYDINGEQHLGLDPSCTFAGPQGPEEAVPAVRLSAFLDAFPGRSKRTSICSSDLSSPLLEIGGTAKKLVGDPCIDTDELADASPDPGIQPACEVVDVRDSAPSRPISLPSCTGATGDCYEIVSDPVACPTAADHMRVRFHRATTTDDTWTSIRCQTR